MNPNTVRGQSYANAVLLCALAVLERPWVTVVLASVGGAWWCYLNLVYTASLRRWERNSGRSGRTPRRADGDRGMALQTIAADWLPLGLALACIQLDIGVSPSIGPFESHYVQGAVAITASMLLVWIASSQVDWYYIRPRLDGIVCEPPCRTSRENRWKGVTRKWYIHRAAASVVTMAAGFAIALLLTLVLDHEAKNVLAAAGGFNAMSLVVLWLMKGEVKSVAAVRENLRSPRYWIGDDVDYDTDFWHRRGYVLHVSVPKTKLVGLDVASGQLVEGVHMREEPTVDMHEVRMESHNFTGCQAGCSEVNPQCAWAEKRPRPGGGRLLTL